MAAAAAALRLNPEDIPALVLSADCFHAFAQSIQALELLNKTCSLSKNSTSLEVLTSEYLLRIGRPADAQLRLERVLLKSSESTENYSSELYLLARECYIKVLVSQGLYEKAWLEVQASLPFCERLAGQAVEILQKLGQDGEALLWAQKYHDVILNDDSALLLANSYFRCGNVTAYGDTLLEAAQACPEQSSLGTLAAQALFDRSDHPHTLEAATKCLDSVLSRQPQVFEAFYLHSRQLLLDGSFVDGWKAYEARLRLPSSQLYAACPSDWSGEHPGGKSVVVVAEQGVGDVLFFARFLPQLASEAARVFLLANARLAPLLRRSYPQIIILEQPSLASALAGSDALWIPLGSLPLRYGSSLNAIQASLVQPQLKTHPRLDSAWRLELPDRCCQKLRIGISLTAGNVHQAYQQQKRDVDAGIVAVALDGLDACLVDLQHRDRLVNVFGCNAIHFPGITEDLDQLCALINQLDVLVTSDQTNAFLAGMLGVPTVAIVPPNPHFMFMRAGERTPWFSSLRIVRAKRWADWAGCQSAIRASIDSLLTEHTPTLQHDPLAP
ncbi:hypothetical protein [Vulcanococcus sp. Clear-D1]|uniref:hypothetical protein n=1 Tax=Vulcanococcus sp. Clear-D1 TaxID=2766970 RepID=UPI00199184C2|nr:hypothetical protein [Vulcanococcus sp. Clear-D1]MBD1194964.1 hypothetical protein [Vulcanococcus sp. Clear-D1]